MERKKWLVLCFSGKNLASNGLLMFLSAELPVNQLLFIYQYIISNL